MKNCDRDQKMALTKLTKISLKLSTIREEQCLSSRQLPPVELSAKTVRRFSLELLVRALLTAQENIAHFAIERNKHR